MKKESSLSLELSTTEPGLIRNARLSEASAKVVCCKAGDPLLPLTTRIPFPTYETPPTANRWLLFYREFHPIHYRRKVSCKFYSPQTRGKRNICKKKHVFGVVGIGDPYLILSYWYMYKNVQNRYSEEQSDLGLHCLLRPICPNISNYYGNSFKTNN